MINIYKKTIYSLLTFSTICFFCRCNIINPAEQTPTYIHIDSFLFQTSELHDIKCAWVYYNNNPIGAFDLPATVPIVASGTGKLEIAPGIAIDGRNERPSIYPFYRIDTSTLVSQPGKIINYTPKTKYYDAVKQYIIADFEAGITKFAKWEGSADVVVVTADSLKYDGIGGGAIFLNAPTDSSTDSTTIAFKIPNGAAFIEITYRSNIPFALGMQAYLGSGYASSKTYIAGVSPSSTWRKFYLNVTGFTAQFPADKYNLYIKTAMPSEQTSGWLLFDNVKLVTF